MDQIKTNKYLTYFFRKEIDVLDSDIKNNDEVEINLNVDDGAIVFINDKEVIRYNYSVDRLIIQSQQML